MTTQTKRTWRPKFSNVIALVALFAVLGGSAYAGSKAINGKKIKKGTVTSKALKDKTIKTKDISDGAVADLQGQEGPQGQQGPQGPAGVIAPDSFDESGSLNLTDGVTTDVGAIPVASGDTYLVNAKMVLFGGPNVDAVVCSMQRNDVEIDRILWNPPADNTRTPAAMQALATGAGASISIECESDGGTGSVLQRKIAAIPVS
jgi:hypothetical protein